MFEDTSRLSAAFGDDENGGYESSENHAIVIPTSGRSIKEDGDRKIFLPRGSAETRFAPRQYYYLASKSGVVPGWAVAPHDSARL